MRSIMVTICICNNSETRKEIFGSKNRTCLHPITGVPNSKTITVEIFSASTNSKLHLEFPISNSNRLKYSKLFIVFKFVKRGANAVSSIPEYSK